MKHTQEQQQKPDNEFCMNCGAIIHSSMTFCDDKCESKYRKNQSQEQQPVSDKDIELLEEIRQIKAVIIHFATLDKMPTLQLLDREHLIAHVVTIAQQILRDFPPKQLKAALNKQGSDAVEFAEWVELEGYHIKGMDNGQRQTIYKKFQSTKKIE